MKKITLLLRNLWMPLKNQYLKLYNRNKQALLPIEDYENYLA